MADLFIDQQDYSRWPDGRPKTQDERLAEFERRRAASVKPKPNPYDAHRHYYEREDGTPRPRAEREALKAADERAARIVEHRAAQLEAAKPKRPPNFAQQQLDLHAGDDDWYRKHGARVTREAKAREKEIDQQLEREAEQAQREADPLFVAAQTNASTLVDSVRPEAREDAMLAVAILNKTGNPADYWKLAAAARQKNRALIDADLQAAADQRFASANHHQELSRAAQAEEEAIEEANRHAIDQ